MSGIYSILNKINGKIYVGQSVNPSKRGTDHRCKLNNNTHINPHLQKAWNKYGESAFEFNILEYCSEEDLNDNESWWVDYFNSTDRDEGYNIESGGKSNYTVSEETREKFIGKNNPMYGKSGELSPRFGKKLSDETKQKIRESRFGTSAIDKYGGLEFVKDMATTGITKDKLGEMIGISGDAIDSYLRHRNRSWSEFSPNVCIKNNSRRQILIDLGGVDFLKDCIRKGLTQREIASKYNLGTKGVIYRYLNSLDITWASLVEEVNN